MSEWNAAVYHRVSNPQLEWGLPVLARLPLEGTERVLDVGCGSGRLTERLLDRLPGGSVVAVDRSGNMVAAAREYLRERHGQHVRFVQCDATALPFRGAADAVFSTATFHWILDHDRLFASLYTALAAGGRLVAQCGGARNLDRTHALCTAVMDEPDFAPWFAGWSPPWEFADAETTARRLTRAGFADVRTWVEPSFVTQPEGRAYREFVEHVICRPHLARLPEPALRQRFMEKLTDAAGRETPPFVLDYWRLNIDARRP
jgi:trans-aconitate 2-methyltransferase